MRYYLTSSLKKARHLHKSSSDKVQLNVSFATLVSSDHYTNKTMSITKNLRSLGQIHWLRGMPVYLTNIQHRLKCVIWTDELHMSLYPCLHQNSVEKFTRCGYDGSHSMFNIGTSMRHTILDHSWEIHQNLKIDVITNVQEY